MPSFFIDRPIFAWIIALTIVLAGAMAVTQLPVAQFPGLSPPRIVINTVYPGASAETVDDDVASIIEQSLDGADGMQYYETSSDSLGELQINATFSANTNPDIAMVDVQNRLKQVESRLPHEVVQQGINVSKATGSFLMLVSMTSPDGSRDPDDLGEYLSRYVVRELKRAPGVGSAQLWDAERAMRIWLDPARLHEYGLSAADVTSAIGIQNAAVAAGTLGDAPTTPGQQFNASITVRGQLRSSAEFGDILLRTQRDGSAVRLRDVARIELGRDNYAFSSRLNGLPAATIGVDLSPRGNALATSQAVRDRLARIATTLPPGMKLSVPFDGARFVHVAIREVLLTLAEAIALVFLVMWLFLGDLRYALVPAVVIPVSLMGAFLAMYRLGFSINVFTLFGLVLAIGILVDDAIVVVESVDRAMRQIGGAIIGVTVVLIAVFVPMAFFPGAVGDVYRQFSVAMIAAMAVSAFTALTLTPALCANLLSATGPNAAWTPSRCATRSLRNSTASPRPTSTCNCRRRCPARDARPASLYGWKTAAARAWPCSRRRARRWPRLHATVPCSPASTPKACPMRRASNWSSTGTRPRRWT
jgi:HAE1 family hydrophobic/amphiphilic exporter-1